MLFQEIRYKRRSKPLDLSIPEIQISQQKNTFNIAGLCSPITFIDRLQYELSATIHQPHLLDMDRKIRLSTVPFYVINQSCARAKIAFFPVAAIRSVETLVSPKMATVAASKTDKGIVRKDIKMPHEGSGEFVIRIECSNGGGEMRPVEGTVLFLNVMNTWDYLILSHSLNWK